MYFENQDKEIFVLDRADGEKDTMSKEGGDAIEQHNEFIVSLPIQVDETKYEAINGSEPAVHDTLIDSAHCGGKTSEMVLNRSLVYCSVWKVVLQLPHLLI